MNLIPETEALGRLRAFFGEHPRIALAYSGGTDSAFLLHAAVSMGADVLPVFARTPFCTASELEDARGLCSAEGLELAVADVDVLSSEPVRLNGPDRCYHCKRAILSAVREAALRNGYAEVADGTNASDPEDGRPGMRALRELGVLSPLRSCGIAKDMVRSMSRDAGLPTWDRPTNSCLATRVATGVPLTPAMLRLVEDAEGRVSALGFSGFRVRTDGRSARLQLPGSRYDEGRARWQDILDALGPLFGDITLDEDTREGR